MITCRLREDNFEKSSLADFGCDARSFAGDREAAVWVGLGAVARSWEIGWRPGAAGVAKKKMFFHSTKLKISMMITMLTQAYCIVRINTLVYQV